MIYSSLAYANYYIITHSKQLVKNVRFNEPAFSFKLLKTHEIK